MKDYYEYILEQENQKHDAVLEITGRRDKTTERNLDFQLYMPSSKGESSNNLFDYMKQDLVNNYEKTIERSKHHSIPQKKSEKFDFIESIYSDERAKLKIITSNINPSSPPDNGKFDIMAAWKEDEELLVELFGDH